MPSYPQRFWEGKRLKSSLFLIQEERKQVPGASKSFVVDGRGAFEDNKLQQARKARNQAPSLSTSLTFERV